METLTLRVESENEAGVHADQARYVNQYQSRRTRRRGSLHLYYHQPTRRDNVQRDRHAVCTRGPVGAQDLEDRAVSFPSFGRAFEGGQIGWMLEPSSFRSGCMSFGSAQWQPWVVGEEEGEPLIDEQKREQ